MKYEIRFKIDVLKKDIEELGYDNLEEFLIDNFEGYDEDNCPEVEVDRDSIELTKITRKTGRAKE